GVALIEPRARHRNSRFEQNPIPLSHGFFIPGFLLAGLNPRTLPGVAKVEPAEGRQELAIDDFGGVTRHSHDAVRAHALMHDAQGLSTAIAGVGGQRLALDEDVDQFVRGIEQGLMGAAGRVLEISLDLELGAGGKRRPGGAAHPFEHLLDLVDGALARVGIIESEPEGHAEDLRVAKEPFPGEVARRPPESQDAQEGATYGMTALLLANGDEEFVLGKGNETALLIG